MGRAANKTTLLWKITSANPSQETISVGILSKSEFSSNNPRTTARGIRCEEHSSFILSWNLIGQRENKSHYVTEIVSWLGFADVIFGADKRQPEIRLRSQAIVRQTINSTMVVFVWTAVVTSSGKTKQHGGGNKNETGVTKSRQNEEKGIFSASFIFRVSSTFRENGISRKNTLLKAETFGARVHNSFLTGIPRFKMGPKPYQCNIINTINYNFDAVLL